MFDSEGLAVSSGLDLEKYFNVTKVTQTCAFLLTKVTENDNKGNLHTVEQEIFANLDHRQYMCRKFWRFSG